MKKNRASATKAKKNREHDFSGGVQGKYSTRYSAGSNVVVLSPEVAQAFPNSESANRALRAHLKLKSKLKKVAKPVRRDRKAP